MKVILHIGFPKTGTTSIQATLSQSRDQLLEHNILYPKIHRFKNQNLLSIAFNSNQNVPREYFKLFTNDYSKARSFSIKMWKDLSNQVLKHSPRLIVLSGEYFSGIYDTKKLGSFISTLFPQVKEKIVVAYLRKRSEYYLSHVQQTIKASSIIPAPEKIEYAKRLNKWLGFGDVVLNEFSSTKLAGGNVVKDFLNLVKNYSNSFDIIPIVKRNVSLSAEGMSLLHIFRKYAFPNSNNVFFPESSILQKIISEIEAEKGNLSYFTKPILRPHITEFLDYFPVDDEQLNSLFNFQFSKNNVVKQNKYNLSNQKYYDINDITSLDNEKLSELQMLVLKRILTFKKNAVQVTI